MNFFADEILTVTPGNVTTLSRSVFSPANGQRATIAQVTITDNSGSGRLAYRFGAAPDVTTSNAKKYFLLPFKGRYLQIKGFDNIASIQFKPVTTGTFTIYVAYAA